MKPVILVHWLLKKGGVKVKANGELGKKNRGKRVAEFEEGNRVSMETEGSMSKGKRKKSKDKLWFTNLQSKEIRE